MPSKTTFAGGRDTPPNIDRPQRKRNVIPEVWRHENKSLLCHPVLGVKQRRFLNELAGIYAIGRQQKREAQHPFHIGFLPRLLYRFTRVLMTDISNSGHAGNRSSDL